MKAMKLQPYVKNLRFNLDKHSLLLTSRHEWLNKVIKIGIIKVTKHQPYIKLNYVQFR